MLTFYIMSSTSQVYNCTKLSTVCHISLKCSLTVITMIKIFPFRVSSVMGFCMCHLLSLWYVYVWCRSGSDHLGVPVAVDAAGNQTQRCDEQTREAQQVISPPVLPVSCSEPVLPRQQLQHRWWALCFVCLKLVWEWLVSTGTFSSPASRENTV